MSFLLSSSSYLVEFVYLIIGLFSLFFVFRRSKVVRSRREQPPLAGGAWPIIGHLSLLTGSQTPHRTLGAMADKYGPIFSMKIGSRLAVVINNWRMAKECFTTNDLVVSSRPRLVAIQRLTYDQAMFAFAPHGPYWREVRKIATLELLSNRRVELLSQVRALEVKTSIEGLFKKKRECGEYVRIEFKEWFGELALNVVLRVVAGKRYFGDASDVGEEDARRCMKALRNFFYYLGQLVLGDAVPWLRWLDLGGHEKAMKETAKELDDLVGEWLEEHRRKRTLGDEGKGDGDFIDAMLSILDGVEELGGHHADTIIKATSMILIGAAIDTSTVTITWAISLLLNNPNALKQAQNELDIEIGKERAVKESDLSKLVYMQAIVKETLRLHPPAILSGPREFTEDCTVNGYFIPKGTQLITNLWKIHTDPTVWSDPLEFKPERFLTAAHKDVDVTGHHFELIPFGSGRRICPGMSFALQMIHLTLATFLQSFEISKPSDEPIDMTEVFGLTSMKATPLDVLIKPRTSSIYDC